MMGMAGRALALAFHFCKSWNSISTTASTSREGVIPNWGTSTSLKLERCSQQYWPIVRTHVFLTNWK
jgi:hypothetical protein